VARALTGAVSARIGASDPRRAVIRALIGGAAGLALTYGIGHYSALPSANERRGRLGR
jgi:VIT1/CCC1 family predicted Fe2+/Mn2+ transporter